MRTRLSTFENYAIFLQPQGDSFFGPMLADVCCTGMSGLTEILTKYRVNGQICVDYNRWKKGSVFYIILEVEGRGGVKSYS